MGRGKEQGGRKEGGEEGLGRGREAGGEEGLRQVREARREKAGKRGRLG